MLLASAHKPKGLAFCFWFFLVFLGKSKSESKVPIHIAPQEICLSVLFLLRHVVDSLSLSPDDFFFFLLPFDFFWLFLFTGLDVGLLRHLPPSRFG
jgi:hypothetical protein